MDIISFSNQTIHLPLLIKTLSLCMLFIYLFPFLEEPPSYTSSVHIMKVRFPSSPSYRDDDVTRAVSMRNPFPWIQCFVKEGAHQFSSVQFSQSCPTLCDPMNRSTPGLPVHHQLLEFTQTHVHRVSDAIQPTHSLSSPPPPAPNPSKHQDLLQWVNSLHEVAKVLDFQLQH